MKSTKTVDEYIQAHENWQKALIRLRQIMLDSGMEEVMKWGAPHYTVNGKNVAGLAAFKQHFAIWFHNGALLKDAKKVLVNAQEGKTKALRQWRFESLDDLDEKLIKTYVKEAIQNQEAGKEIKAPKRKPLIVPDELREALAKDVTAAENYDEMGLSRQREYAEYIAEAKREDTKQKRLEKILPMIRDNRGLNDKYR